MRIAIVGGSGKMGSWFGGFLAREGHEVVLIGRHRERLQTLGHELGTETSDNPETVTRADVIMLSVPMDAFESVARRYSAYITPGQTVVEITSVKVAPLDAMHRHLKTDKVLGIHPMFGPGARDFANHNFILTPTNGIEKALAVKARAYIEARGGKVSLMSPREHDETMAIVLGLPHIIALVSADTLLRLGNFERLEQLGGTTCKLLLMLADSVLTEDPELYALIQANLPGMSNIHKLFQKNLSEWSEIVSKKSKQEFIERMQAMSEARQKADPEFRKAYEEMYRTLER